MPTLEEFVTNKETYPDTLKITLADGVESTLGEIRSGFMKEKDYRKKTMELSEVRRQHERELQDFEAARLDAEAKLAALAQQLVTARPGATQDDITEELESSPIAKKLYAKINELEGKVKEREVAENEMKTALGNWQQAQIVDQHRKVLASIKQTDPDMDEEELVNFARQNYIPRLDWAYRLYKYDDTLKSASKKAEEEGVAKGYEKAKKELLQPVLQPRRAIMPLDDKAPKTFEEAADRAMADPEIQKLIVGDGGF